MGIDFEEKDQDAKGIEQRRNENLIQQPDYQAARNYWKVLKNRLNKEGSEPVTKCNRLKLVAEDGKIRNTDVADPETLLRLIQSVPSLKTPHTQLEKNLILDYSSKVYE